VVALGGAMGTLARIGIELSLGTPALGWGLATLLVNIVGAFALGVVLSHGLPTLSPVLRSGITVGFLGSFTTFSAVALFVATNAVSVGIGYLVVHGALGVGAAWMGSKLGSRLISRKGSLA